MKKIISAKKVYDSVFTFCKKSKYLDKLHSSLSVSEGERFNKKNITTTGLDVLDAIHCVDDKKRSMFFLNEVLKKVKFKDFVVEAGIGTGILSIAAATKKSKVVGLEINKDILDLANKIKTFVVKDMKLFETSLNFFKVNAIKYVPNQKIDVIISENLYTGMFYEKQVEIMNHLIKYLKRDGIIIPSGLTMGAILSETRFLNKPKPYELFVPDQLGNSLKVKPLSNSKVYSNLDFSKHNSLIVDKEIDFSVVKNGTINSVIIWTEVLLGDNIKIGRKDTEFLNSDIVIALPNFKEVKNGQRVKMKMKYLYGSKPEKGIFSLINN